MSTASRRHELGAGLLGVRESGVATEVEVGDGGGLGEILGLVRERRTTP